MKIQSSVLKRSLAQLGLVTLTVGGLSTPALAAFSPLDQPLASDFFVGVDVTQEASGLTGLAATEGLGKSLFVGKNLFNDGNFIAGVVGDLAYNSSLFGKPGHVVGLGGYLTYLSNPGEATGLKLGLLVKYGRVIGHAAEEAANAAKKEAEAKDKVADEAEALDTAATNARNTANTADQAATAAEEADRLAAATDAVTLRTDADAKDELADAAEATANADATKLRTEANTAQTLAADKAKMAADTYHGIFTTFSESYTVNLGNVANYPIALTQFANLKAAKQLKEGSDFKDNLTADLNGGAVLSTQIGPFSPFLSADATKVLCDGTDQATKTNFAIGGGFGLKIAEHAHLKFGVRKPLGENTNYQANLGLDLLF